MPIKTQSDLPAKEILENENIFVMDELRAIHQDIRPLNVLILNNMPVKQDTELQLLRALSNTPLQVDVTFMNVKSHVSQNTSASHLNKFYTTLDEIKGNKYDGMIVTGAPVEDIPFEQVDYWEEICEIFDWAGTHVTSTLHICWAAQAGVFYRYGIDKRALPRKLSGIFEHRVLDKTNPLMRGFDDAFRAPHSRYTESDSAAMHREPKLKVLAESDEAGAYICCSDDLRHVYVFGHGEYDAATLHNEYMRDTAKGLSADPPRHYYVNDRIGAIPPLSWRAHESLLIGNWLNYCVYQATPYDIGKIE